ncbi:hypothetical protein [Nevskia sp.]|uniref:hypothetical protein n=1 Tax=Nevskia sp. TaxID=1929292 RepID=UPI0025D60371|nr:hypothetical protein [Nevskia sp.]
MGLDPITARQAGLFAAAHQAFSTRRVPGSAFRTLLAGPRVPVAGHLVLAEIVELGQHRQLELVSGRKAHLFPGSRIIVAYGNRYAPDQYEALVPADLGPCDLVAGGGLAARETQRNAAMKSPTRIRPLGLIGDDLGQPLNLSAFALPPQAMPAATPAVFVVCGSSMNAGKTHTVAMLVRGLLASGRSTAACKVTGTGSGNDLWKMRDIGALTVLDFADAGYPSTYGTPVAELEAAFTTLIAACASAGADTVVVEIADGLGQVETAGLLRSLTLRQHTTAVLFAAADPLAAAAGERWLRAAGLPLIAVSGLMTACPESNAEARELLGTPVLGAEQLEAGLAFLALLDGPRAGSTP